MLWASSRTTLILCCFFPNTYLDETKIIYNQFLKIMAVISEIMLLILPGWVNTLVGGQQSGARGFMFFIVNVDLTEEGLGKIPVKYLNTQTLNKFEPCREKTNVLVSDLV